MALTISVTNRKGGVGKTTSTAALAGEFAHRGLRVLCVDFDPQGSLSAVAGYLPGSFQPDESALALVLPDLWEPPVDAAELPVDAPWGGHIVRADKTLAKAVPELATRKGSIKRLDAALRPLSDRYDLTLIDTRPSEDVLVHNALQASDAVLIPVELAFQSVLGCQEILTEVGEFITYDKPELRIIGVFGTLADRTLHSREISEVLAEKLPDELRMRTAVPRRTAVVDSQGLHVGLREYALDNAATQAYAALADELCERLPVLQAVGA